VETKPYGGYSQFYDVKITQLIEQVNPGGQVWNVRVGRKHHAPYGVFEGMTIFDAGAKVAARVKVVVASVMQPPAEYLCQPNAT